MVSEPAYTVIEVGGYRQPGLPLVTFSLVFLDSDGAWQGSCGLELPVLARQEGAELLEKLPAVDPIDSRAIESSDQFGWISRCSREQFAVPTAMTLPPVSDHVDNTFREKGRYAGLDVASRSVVGNVLLDEVFAHRVLVTRAGENERTLLFSALGNALQNDWNRRISVESLRNFFLANPTLRADDLKLIEELDTDYHDAETCASRALSTARLFSLLLQRFRELGLRTDLLFERNTGDEAEQNSPDAATDGADSESEQQTSSAPATFLDSPMSSGRLTQHGMLSQKMAEMSGQESATQQSESGEKSESSSDSHAATEFHIASELRRNSDPSMRPRPVQSSQEYSEAQRHPAALRAESRQDRSAPTKDHQLVINARKDITRLLAEDEHAAKVITAMIKPQDSLESLIRDLRISRERARSAQRNIARTLNSFGSFRSLAQSIFVDFLPLATIEDLIRSYPGIQNNFDDESFNLLDLVIALTPTLERRGEEVWTKGYNVQVATVLDQCADEAGVVNLEDVAKELHLELPLVRHIVSRLEEDIVFHEDKALTKTANYAERARAALTVYGHPMTSQQIIAFYGKGMQRSLANVLTRNPIFIRVGNDLWALKEWDLPEFTTTTAWLRKTLAEAGQCSLHELLDCAPSLNISPASIRSYLAGDEFVVSKGTVTLRDRVAEQDTSDDASDGSDNSE